MPGGRLSALLDASRRSRRADRLLKGVFWAGLSAIAVLALLPRPPELPALPSDKLQHLAAFAALSVGAVLAYPAARRIGQGLGLAAFGAAIEAAQLVPALNRSGELLDWLADLAAIAVFLPLAAWLRGRALRRKPA